jgi:hypothetical protein
MKKILLLTLLCAMPFLAPAQIQTPEFLQVTTIESLVVGGLGRSRMITTDSNGKMQEVPLTNFYSLTGINFDNVRDNDRTITQKINELAKEGWELLQVAAAAESSDKTTGIFITRYIFKRPSQESGQAGVK